MNIDGKLIGMELRSLRMKCGYSAEYVCKNVDINISSLYKYERDAGKCRIKILQQLLNLYNVDIKIFFEVISAYNHIEEE